ncbi:MAG: class I SAM-dependent methyltransferase [Dehalococcoidales bacterium]
MKNQTQESYNLSAENYRKRFENYAPYLSSIEKFISLLPPNSRILDAGCGPGINAKRFVEHHHKVTGIDFSSEMIRLAKENCPDGKFIAADLKDIRQDVKYDAVCASFVIVHMTDAETDRFLEKLPHLLTVVKPMLYLSFMTGKTPGYEKTSFSDSSIYFNYHDEKLIKQKLGKLGFALLSEDEEPYQEIDGTITQDVFLIMEYEGNNV